MADPKYPLEDNVGENLEELFRRISIQPDGSKPGNLDGYLEKDVSLSATVAKEIYHHLNRLPNGYIVLSRSQFCKIKQTAESTSSLSLMSDVDTTITVLIL